MTRRFTTRTAGIFAALFLASCIGDSTGPGEHRFGMVNILPDFNVHGIHSVDVNRVLVRFTKPNSTVTVYDTIVPFPAAEDTLQLSIQLPISGASEQFLMTILMIDDPLADTVFQSGPTLITATAGTTSPPTQVSFVYVGVGSHAAGVRFLATPTQVLNGDTVLFTAEAFDSNNVTIPNTPIVWTSSDTARARIPADSIGRVIGGAGRGPVSITAALLTPQSATSSLLLQPKPTTVVVQGGSGQTGIVGQPLSQPVTVRVNAADLQGVQGVVVNFAVTTGGGSLSQLADTTDASGDASVVWTLGATLGAQSVGVAAAGIAGTTSIPATGTVGAVKKLAFQAVPANVVAGQPITPPVTVAAQDTFGNLVASYTGAVSLAIGANPAGGTLSGTTTVAAVAGVATFSGLSINNIGASYTFVATATGLTSATSGGLAVTPPAGANAWLNVAGGNWSTAGNWSKGTVPSATDTVFIGQAGTYTVNLDVNATVARLDVGGASGTQTLQVNANTLTMAGNGAFTANGRLALGGTGTIRGAGTVDIAGGLDWTAGTFGGDGGTTRVLAGGTLTISGATVRTHVNHTLELGGTGTWSGNALVNSGLASVLRVTAGGTLTVTGDPQLSLSQGGAATLDNLGTVVRSTSATAFAVNVAISGAGTWNVQSGILDIRSGGTPNGTFNVSAGAGIQVNGGTFTFGAGSNVTGAGSVSFLAGTVTLTGAYGPTGTTINGGTANFSGAATMTTGTLSVQSGSLGGTGLLTVSGAMNWNGGALAGGGGTTRVLSSGSLGIGGTVAHTFTTYTLEQASATGLWTGTATINAGLTSVLRILAGGSLDVQGTVALALTQGGSTLFDNQGTLLKSGAGAFPLGGTVTSTGTITVTNGTLVLNGGGTLANAIGITSPGLVQVAGGTFGMTNGLNVSGTGRLQLTAGTLGNAAATDTARFTTLELNAGTLAQAGVVRVATLLDWTGSAAIVGTGKVLIPAGSALTMGTIASRTFTNGIIENNATLTWGSTFTLNSGLGAVLRNMPGATVDVTADGLFQNTQGGAATFDNQGTFNRTTSTNSINWTVAFNQAAAATSSINTGTLVLSGGGTHQGAFVVASGAFLDYSNGVFVFSAHQASGAGTVRWQNSAVLNTASATDSAKFGNLQLNNGTIAETGVVQVGGLLDWAGITVINGPGKVFVPNTATLSITGTAGRTFTTGTIEVGGTTTWSGSLQINTGLSAVFRNLPSGNFILSGDGLFAQNQGFPQALFDNQGTFARNSSTGTATWGVFYQDTVGTMTVSTGTFALSGGARLGGSKTISAGAILDLTSGTVSVRPATAFAGTGTLRASGGSLLGPDSASAVAPVTNAVSVNNFALSGTASLAHEGLFIVNTQMDWAGGTIASNVVGLGGTTRIAGTLNITFAAAGGTLSGAHTLDNQGTVNYSGVGNLSTGLGPVINNSGNWVWSGNGSVLNNQGAPTIQFNNVGNLQRTTSAAAVTLDAVMNKTGGFNIAIGTLILPRGSVTAFQGNVNGAGGTLQLSGGTFTQTGTIAYAGTLQLTGGTLVLNGFGAGVAAAFTTSAGGNLVMTNVADSLDINGNAAFTGATGTINAGVIRVAGNFTQTGVSSFQGLAQSAAVANRVVLDGATGTQVVSFADPVNSFFRRLLLQRGAGTSTVLQTNVRTTFFSMGGGTYSMTGIASPMSRLIADTVAGANSGSVSMQSPLVLVVNDALVDSNVINVDTVVFAGANQNILRTFPGGGAAIYTYKSIRVSQTGGTVATVAWPVTPTPSLTGGIEVTSGTLNLNGRRINAFGLVTSGTGILRMQNAADSLIIAGPVSFLGGSTTGQLTAGVLAMSADFTQGGNAAAYAPSGTHRAVMSNLGTTQNVTFANPTTSFFHRWEIPAPSATRSVILQTNAQVNDSLIMQGAGVNNDLVGAGTSQRLRVQGVVRMINATVGPLLAPPVLEMNTAAAAFSVDSIFQVGRGVSPDTTVFLSGQTAMIDGTPLRYKSVRAATGGVLTYNTAGINDSIAGNLVADAGTFAMGSGTLTAIKLRTINTGVLRMQVAGTQLIVGDSAIFGGGSTTGQLTQGTLQLRGNLLQQGSTTAFAPSGAHTTSFGSPAAAPTNSDIQFTNPTSSFFANVSMSKGVSPPRGTVTLRSDALATGTATVANSTDLRGPGFRFTVNGIFTQTASTTSPTTNTLLALELGATPNVNTGVSAVDTIVFNGAIAALPTAGFTYNNVRINTTGTITLPAVTIAGDLDIATGTASIPGNFTINGKLRTRGSGVLAMPVGGAPFVTVVDSAIFGGGSTAGLLTTGTLRLKGHFANTTAAGFQASGSHITEFNGPVGVAAITTQNVTMTSPGTGAANSRFGRLALTRSSAGALRVRINLLTSAQAANVFDSSNGQADSILGTGTVTLTTDTMQLTNTVLNNVPLVVTNTGVSFTAQTLRFENMDPTTTYLTLTRTNTSISLGFANVTFATLRTTGRYFSVTTTGTIATGAFVSFTTSTTPGTMLFANGDYFRGGTQMPTISWNGASNP